MSNNVEEKILHGTTTVGIKATDGVVLCADMRASAGYFIANNNTMKIQKIEQHVGLTLAGGVADAQNIVDVLRYHANLHRIQNQEPIPVNSLARLTSLMFHQNPKDQANLSTSRLPWLHHCKPIPHLRPSFYCLHRHINFPFHPKILH